MLNPNFYLIPFSGEDKATFFSIEYHNNYKVVKNSRTGRTYVLVQCGTPSPTDVNNATEIYQIPITKAAAMETTVVPYLEVSLFAGKNSFGSFSTMYSFFVDDWCS